jgi:hypothetical protein
MAIGLKKTDKPVENTAQAEITPFEIKHNPEVDAQIDGFLKTRPELVKKIDATPKEYFARKFVFSLVQREQERVKYDASIKAALQRPENAGLRKELEHGVRNVKSQDAKEELIVRDAKALVRQGKLSLKSESQAQGQSIS